MEYQEIIDRKKAIVNSPIKRIPEDKLKNVVDQFYKRNPKSLENFTQLKTIVPGGLQHNLGAADPFGLVFRKAKDDKMYDIDGNVYTDYLMAGGPIILGHHFEPLDSKIIELISECGPAVGLTHEYELRYAQEIVKHFPGIDMVRFLASGTEADMVAVRIARVYTGKEKIIKIGGNYHGWSDQFVLSTNFPGTGPSEAEGIPAGCYENTVEVIQNDFEGLTKAFEKYKNNIAAVIAEATGGHAGTFLAHPDWNKTLRELCDQNGALLIFDEVITGFRLALGGAQVYYGITPDLTVLGKIISHGYAGAGAVGGKKEIMACCHPSSINGKKAFTGGTLSANPIMVTAGYYAMKYSEEFHAVDKAADYATKLTNALNDLFSTRKDLPFFVYNIQSIMHLETACHSGIALVENPVSRAKEVMERYKVLRTYCLALLTQGVIPLGDRFYCCMMHGEDALQKTLKAWEYVLSLIPEV
ncbi:MAG: aminotransferase class III-fold pyridoxal phosphate-dependent enzyme [Pelolinea sp.]|nr:aminotransferase class III-fold pyridoxal phosphate-dependent enzyme [Pelolinea sp.]